MTEPFTFYDRLVDGLLERGISPVVTLYHWDLPLALQERGGWTSPYASDWFAEYAGVLVDRLGDRVDTWVTLNEPQVFAFTGHGRGRHAPGVANWPTALLVAADARAPFGYRLVRAPGVPRTTMGWEVHPDGLRQVLRWLQETYAPRSIVITENGAAFPERAPIDGGSVRDIARRSYLAAHVAAAAQALADGVPLTGYFAWSLLDNFEWEKGYGQRFGLVRVDYATLRRSLKASGAWYGGLLAARSRASRSD